MGDGTPTLLSSPLILVYKKKGRRAAYSRGAPRLNRGYIRLTYFVNPPPAVGREIGPSAA